ncbi:hypothetical protein [Deinococcus sp.]|uniref:hypothetical protein n=1 Tax=Deinococcus sp. TaxID=47478 RepID=UPI0025C17DA1|nr:hypothetical protein [Deinococcus sp.]
MLSDIRHQIELAAFPAGVQVTHYAEGDSWVIRALQGRHGMEILLTEEAAKMYGEGPAVNLALTRLKHAAAQELPPMRPDGTFERAVFLGD